MPYSTPKGREEAARVVAISLEKLAASGATPAQLSDLADAMDAFRVGTYNVAVELALVALRLKSDPAAQRPPRMARSLADLAAEWLEMMAPAPPIRD